MIELIHGDCLIEMEKIQSESIDLILCDLPYGKTRCKWDVIIPFSNLWDKYKNIRKGKTVIALFGNEPFSSHLRLSNLNEFKYDWIWTKPKPTGFLNAKKQPLRNNEIISIFYKKQPNYYPQFWESNKMNSVYRGGALLTGQGSTVYGKMKPTIMKELNVTKRYPVIIIKFNNVNGQSKGRTGHPSQKPVPLLEYLIKTYTNEGDLVLDNCMGSGSTGVACKNLNRRFIGIEKDETFFNIAKKRIEEA